MPRTPPENKPVETPAEITASAASEEEVTTMGQPVIAEPAAADEDAELERRTTERKQARANAAFEEIQAICQRYKVAIVGVPRIENGLTVADVQIVPQ